jgi:hypothetical protein
MSLQQKDIITLSKMVANASPKAATNYSFEGENFTYNELNSALRNEMNALAPTYREFEINKNLIYQILEETIDDVLPARVMQQYEQFAEIRTVAQGDKAIFVQRITEASKRRAKRFITKVSPAGVYEVFRLDGQKYELPTTAIGGAAQIGLEEFLDGRITMADVLDIVMEGMDDLIYSEIAKALKAMATSLPTANKVEATTFDEAEMDKLISIADAYGERSTIYCTYEFAATMVPSDGWVSNAMKDERWANGYIANYKGHQVVVLRQSYTDLENTEKAIDPTTAYVIPTGTEKPVKVVFEGGTIMRDEENQDWSREVQVYKKVGVGTIAMNSVCVYTNKSLA